MRKGKKNMNSYDIIRNILVTEKSALLKEANQYAFKVAPKATKFQIAAAITEIYGVKVASVNIINCLGKKKRVGRSPIVGKRADWKKAIVTLAEGTIELA